MGLFGKKKKKDEDSENLEEGLEEGLEEEKPEDSSSGSDDSGASVASLSVKLEKLTASVEAFTEVRKSFTERFNHTSEQIGELRAMILDRDKSIQEVELKAVKAHDLVDTVQPEKMMTQIQKADAKIEALKANIEGIDAIISRVMDELKEVKRKVEFFRGIEEIVKLSEETKKDLIEMKKVESKMGIHADKIETIYAEMKNRFQKIDVLDSTLQESKAQSEQAEKDVQTIKDKLVSYASKSDLEKVDEKVKKYIDILSSLEKKSSLTRDIDRLKDILDGIR
jgi:chromosome segregation ATPase